MGVNIDYLSNYGTYKHSIIILPRMTKLYTTITLPKSNHICGHIVYPVLTHSYFNSI